LTADGVYCCTVNIWQLLFVIAVTDSRRLLWCYIVVCIHPCGCSVLSFVSGYLQGTYVKAVCSSKTNVYIMHRSTFIRNRMSNDSRIRCYVPRLLT